MLRPSVKAFRRDKVSEISSFGLQFFVVQLGSLFMLSSHNMIVSYWFGAAEVTPVNTVTTIFATGYSLIAALLIPYWSRTTQAIEKGEFAWIRKTIKRVLIIAMVFIAGYIGVAVFYESLSELWLGKRLDYQDGVIAATCALYCVQTVVLCFSQFYYGMGNIKVYMYITIGQMVAMLPLTNLLIGTAGLGAASVKIAATALLLISAIVLPILTYKKIREYEKKADHSQPENTGEI